MPIDPAAAFPTDPTAALINRINELERELRAAPAASAGGGGMLAGVVQTDQPGSLDLGGPEVTFTIPEPGAIVQIYAEAEARTLAGGVVGSVINAYVYEDPPTPGTVGDGIAGPMGWPYDASATWDRRGLIVPTGPNTGTNGVVLAAAGQMLAKWVTPGTHVYRLRYGTNGAGPGGTIGQWRNRVLFARVLL